MLKDIGSGGSAVLLTHSTVIYSNANRNIVTYGHDVLTPSAE